MIEMDASVGASFGLISRQSNRFSPDACRDDLAGCVVYSAVMADLVRLRDELDGEFRRLQARLAA
jgi:hypothetical protein